MTLRKLPDSFRYSINGVVSSRAVKFIGKLHSTLVDIETRDSWWESLRDEVRANTLRIGADLVLGYRETCSIHGDICLLSATGTAVKLDMCVSEESVTCRKQRDPKHRGAKNRPGRCPCEAVGLLLLPHAQIHVDSTKRHTLFRNMKLGRCRRCKQKHVPFVVLSTTEIPAGLETAGTPQYIQSCVTVDKSDQDTRENGANSISRKMPFIELRLYNQLLVKLYSMNYNAVFGISVEMEIGGSLLVGVITGSAVYIPGLPEPGPVIIKSPFQSSGVVNDNYVNVTVSVARKSHPERPGDAPEAARRRHPGVSRAPAGEAAHAAETPPRERAAEGAVGGAAEPAQSHRVHSLGRAPSSGRRRASCQRRRNGSSPRGPPRGVAYAWQHRQRPSQLLDVFLQRGSRLRLLLVLLLVLLLQRRRG